MRAKFEACALYFAGTEGIVRAGILALAFLAWLPSVFLLDERISVFGNFLLCAGYFFWICMHVRAFLLKPLRVLILERDTANRYSQQLAVYVLNSTSARHEGVFVRGPDEAQ